MSDAGTGKTRAWLEVLSHRFGVAGGKALVVAPKSILKAAWADDISLFTPHLTYVVAYAHNRAKAFAEDADIYITNHDAVKWLAKPENRKKYLEGRGFHTLIIDESTAFKHRTSQRAKALVKIAAEFKHRVALSGTPNPNGLLDLWHQVFLLDDGDHLGDSFWRYRSTVCEPVQKGPSAQHIRWFDKPGAAEAVADLLDDMTIRHRFEDCTDIPENHEYIETISLSSDHRRAYDILREHAILELQGGGVSAFNAGVLATKLLQLASGAVYDEYGTARLYGTDRYEYVLDLADQRDQCVIAFNWKHQKEQLIKIAEKKKIPYGVIDGTVGAKQRESVIERFQRRRNRIRVIFAHPASASHGLTLTRGRATIWASPVYNAEHYEQFNRRIYRIGQTQKTETILVTAEDTIDVEVAKKLLDKVERMDDLLEMLT